MKDEYPHIIAECAQCGFRFDILFGVDCPNCPKAVEEPFRPIDALRTALGTLSDKLADPEYMRSKQWVEEPEDEVPKGCHMPKDEASQIYQLKRLFRL